jgi:hypothetical protein
LAGEKDRLDSLKAKINQIKAALQETAEAVGTALEEVLGKTADTVTAGDEAAVDAALAAYDALDEDAKALLAGEKARLDSLKAKIDQLKANDAAPQEAAAAFKTAHATALGKTVNTITAGDEDAVNAALTAYNALGSDVKALLTTEKTRLDSLKVKIDQIKANNDAADAFKTAHAGALAKTETTITAGDEAAVNDALTAYNALSTAVKALLSAEKTLLDDLKAKILNFPETKSFELSFWVDEDGNLVSNAPTSTDLSKAAGDTLTVNAAAGFSGIQWSLNGSDIPAPRGTAYSISIEATQYLPGTYTLGLRGTKNGIPYSINISFTVTE